MVTSSEILTRTGLKSAKTLTRWHRAGIIPKPVVGTHPSGKGKISFWSDEVLNKCVKIVELQRHGHTLSSAVATLELERVEELVREVRATPSIAGILAEKRVKLKDGREVDLLSVFHAVVLREIDQLGVQASTLDSLATEIRERNVIDEALRYLHSGYNPVLLFDGKRARVIADFVLAHELSDFRHAATSLVMPLLLPLERAFSLVGRSLPGEPTAHAAPRVWARQGDTMVEFDLFLGGPLGFELIRETARTLGHSVQNEATDE